MKTMQKKKVIIIDIIKQYYASPHINCSISRYENSLIFPLKALNAGFKVTVSSPA